MAAPTHHPRPTPRRLATVISLTFVLCSPVGSPVTAAGFMPACDGQDASVTGTAGPDRLVGTSGPDVIVGLGGDDSIDGRGGDDVICGGRGADRLRGGPGDDRLRGGADGRDADRAGNFLVGDVLRGGPGDDLLDLGEDDRDGHKPPDTVAFDEAAGPVVVDLSGETGVATGEGTDTMVLVTEVAVLGSAYGDTITGGAAADQLAGGHGDDVVLGGGGGDLLSGDDHLGADYDLGVPHLLGAGESDDDLVRGGDGIDVLWSSLGRDELHGDGDRDLFEVAGAEATSVFGGAGSDVVEQVLATTDGGSSDGGDGVDYLTVLGSPFEGRPPRARFTLDLRTATSTVEGDRSVTGRVAGYEEHRLVGRLRWRFFGTSAPDRVWAMGGGPLRAHTYEGNDHMIGTSRVDRLYGGPGTDRAEGREGADVCRGIERGKRTC